MNRLSPTQRKVLERMAAGAKIAGSSSGVHYYGSDARVPMNTLKALRRAGFVGIDNGLEVISNVGRRAIEKPLNGTLDAADEERCTCLPHDGKHDWKCAIYRAKP